MNPGAIPPDTRVAIGVIAIICGRCGAYVPLGHLHECVYGAKAA